jgi:hypothetical protein
MKTCIIQSQHSHISITKSTLMYKRHDFSTNINTMKKYITKEFKYQIPTKESKLLMVRFSFKNKSFLHNNRFKK